MDAVAPGQGDELAAAENRYRQIQQSNPYTTEISLRNFEKQLPLQWQQAFKHEGVWYVPASPSVAENDKPFVLVRFLTFGSGNLSGDWQLCYYVSPAGEYIPEEIVKGSYAVQHYYRKALNEMAGSQPYGFAAKKSKTATDVSNNMPVPANCAVVSVDWYWQTYVNGVLVNEEYLFTTRELNCEGEGGGGHGDVSTDSTKNPCDSVNKLALNAEFRDKLDSLKLRAEATSNKREYSYYYTSTTANSFEATMSMGEINELSTPLSIPSFTQIDGFMHNHFLVYGKSVSIFSDADMETLISIYSGEKIRNPYTFSMTLVTQHGDRYMLKIDDMARFSAWADASAGLLTEAMRFWKPKEDTHGEDNRALNEKRFLQYLSNGNTGLKFFKGNSNNSWTPKKYSTATGLIVDDVCN